MICVVLVFASHKPGTTGVGGRELWICNVDEHEILTRLAYYSRAMYIFKSIPTSGHGY